MDTIDTTIVPDPLDSDRDSAPEIRVPQTLGAPPWESTDPIGVRVFWRWLAAEGMRPETIRGWHKKVLRFFSWIHETYGIQLVKSNWKHVAALHGWPGPILWLHMARGGP